MLFILREASNSYVQSVDKVFVLSPRRSVLLRGASWSLYVVTAVKVRPGTGYEGLEGE